MPSRDGQFNARLAPCWDPTTHIVASRDSNRTRDSLQNSALILRQPMKQRQHYLTLDGLRGIAAFAVMIYHQQQTAVMGHGYLAVDFFFILSGFVIAKAYESKLLSNMSFTDFALVRVSRLYPLLIAATLLSAAYMAMSSIRRHDDLGWLALLPAAVLALPDPSRTFAADPFPLLLCPVMI